VDALHVAATIDEKLWPRLVAESSEPQLLDLFLLAGWYPAISFAANAARVEPEDWALGWRLWSRTNRRADRRSWHWSGSLPRTAH